MSRREAGLLELLGAHGARPAAGIDRGLHGADQGYTQPAAAPTSKPATVLTRVRHTLVLITANSQPRKYGHADRDGAQDRRRAHRGRVEDTHLSNPPGILTIVTTGDYADIPLQDPADTVHHGAVFLLRDPTTPSISSIPTGTCSSRSSTCSAVLG
jgi:hypothetical protein